MTILAIIGAGTLVYWGSKLGLWFAEAWEQMQEDTRP